MIHVAEFGRQLNALRLPVFMAVLAALLFAMPQQMLEIYRALAQHYATTDGRVEALREVLQSLAGIVTLCLVIWLIARQDAADYGARDEISGIAGTQSRSNVLTWAPRILGVTPLLGAAAGVYGARVSLDVDVGRIRDAVQAVYTNTWMRAEGYPRELADKVAKDDVDLLMSFNTVLINAAAIALAVAVGVFVLLSVFDRPRITGFLIRAATWRKHWLVIALVAFAAVLVGAIVASPVTVPQTIGTIGLICIFLIVLNFALLQLEVWGKSVGIPLIALAILLPFLISAFNGNDNHWIRTIISGDEELPQRTTAGDAFKSWFNSRQTRVRFEGKRFPVYIVAAQGGGIYAAAHAASFLAEIQDLCPGFSHHLFAISGVSGGSVGASVFARLTRDFDWNRHDPNLRLGCVASPEEPYRIYFSDAVNAIFQRDLLSPLAAGMLFPDFVQRFVPAAIPYFDRARSLEYALEDAYEGGVRESNFLPEQTKNFDGLRGPFVRLWDPGQYPNTPALALNATEVDSGNRRVVAPFTFSGSGLEFLPVWDQPEPRRSGTAAPINLPLSTAAIVSARFPWVTPAATFEENVFNTKGGTEVRKLRLVDGGYFENSGAATAIDLVGSIVEEAQKLGISESIEINLLIFTSVGFGDPARYYGLSELLEPVRAMLKTREARAKIEIKNARAMLKGLPTSSSVKAAVVELNLQGYGYPLPLGWRLSDITRHIISSQSGALPTSCPQDGSSNSSSNTQGVSAGCAKLLIHSQLQ